MKLITLAILAFTVMLQPSELIIAAAVSAIVHESGHLTALRALGITHTAPHLGACGLEIQYSGTRSYRADIICALAGPAAGAVLCAFTAALGKTFNSDFCFTMCGCSAALTLFNMLPASALDGGRALFAALAQLSSLDTAMKTLRISTAITALVLVLPGLYISHYTLSGVSIVIAGIWLLVNLRAM